MTPPRRLTMSFDREWKRLVVTPDDDDTVAWLKAMPLELFAELDELGRQLARPDQKFHLADLPVRAAEYQQTLRRLFPTEGIEVTTERGSL